ncbi:hypothetical protein DMUE_1381 [Dictyocoela muelleri]|nr:hypothetical protein DMUE_1381 [Dictyocoela muelleri]
MHRWLLLLEEYDYTLKHITSEENSDADTLSRSMVAISNSNEKIHDITDLIRKINDAATNSPNSAGIYTLLENLHISLIHPGRNKIFNTLKNYLNIKKLKNLISK